MPLMSPPAQNALPAPVTTSARMAGSRATRSSACSSSVRMASSMALRTWGRFRVSVPMPSVTSSSTAQDVSIMMRSGCGRNGTGSLLHLQASVANHLSPAFLLGGHVIGKLRWRTHVDDQALVGHALLERWRLHGLGDRGVQSRNDVFGGARRRIDAVPAFGLVARHAGFVQRGQIGKGGRALG